MSEIIARLQTKSLCSAPRLQCKSYWWPIIGHQCLKNLQSKIFLEQHLDCKSCKMWTNQISQDGSGAVAPARLNYLKISLCQSKLTHGLIVQRESESFLNRQDGSLKFNTSWKSDYGVHKAPEWLLMRLFKFGRKFFIWSDWLFESLLAAWLDELHRMMFNDMT